MRHLEGCNAAVEDPLHARMWAVVQSQLYSHTNSPGVSQHTVATPLVDESLPELKLGWC
jgi:hypothetical protein